MILSLVEKESFKSGKKENHKNTFLKGTLCKIAPCERHEWQTQTSEGLGWEMLAKKWLYKNGSFAKIAPEISRKCDDPQGKIKSLHQRIFHKPHIFLKKPRKTKGKFWLSAVPLSMCGDCVFPPPTPDVIWETFSPICSHFSPFT